MNKDLKLPSIMLLAKKISGFHGNGDSKSDCLNMREKKCINRKWWSRRFESGSLNLRDKICIISECLRIRKSKYVREDSVCLFIAA